MDKGDEMMDPQHNKATRRRTTKAKTVDGQRVTPVTELPASNRVESPPCQLCHNENTFIYATRQRVRYCKCRHCGHTWTFAAKVVTYENIQTR